MFIDALLLAVFAYVYIEILQAPGMILGWLGNVADWLPTWLAKPLISCSTCVSGQLGLWGYIVLTDQYSIIYHILFITLVIFINQIILWVSNR